MGKAWDELHLVATLEAETQRDKCTVLYQDRRCYNAIPNQADVASEMSSYHHHDLDNHFFPADKGICMLSFVALTLSFTSLVLL